MSKKIVSRKLVFGIKNAEFVADTETYEKIA